MTDEIALPELGREIATTGDGIDITRGYTGALLLPYDSVLRNRGGYDLQIYEQVFSDDEVKGTLAQRQLAVTQCEWVVEAGGDRRIDKQAAEWLRGQLHRIGWDNVTTKMLYGVFYGYAVAELIYKVEDGKIAIDRIAVRNRRRFRYGKDGDLRMLTYASMTEGVPCERPYFWNFCCGADHDDEPYGLGLAHWLYWPVLFKRNGIKFWLIFLEKFGMPTAVGEYDDQNTNDAEKAKLLRAVRAIQTDSGIIKPKGMDISLLEASRSGTIDYRTLWDTMNQTIQKVTLGQTASTSGTPGRLGGDDLQGDVRDDIIKADADLVCESFNLGPVRWLMQWNFPTAALPRVYRVTEKPEDINRRAERDGKIHGMGFRPTLAYITETYGGQWTEQQTTPPQLLDANGNPIARDATPAQFGELLAAPTRPPDRVLAEQLEGAAQPLTDAWIARIEAMLDAATSLDELRELLLNAYDDLPSEQLASLIGAATEAAHAAGRYDIAENGDGR